MFAVKLKSVKSAKGSSAYYLLIVMNRSSDHYRYSSSSPVKKKITVNKLSSKFKFGIGNLVSSSGSWKLVDGITWINSGCGKLVARVRSSFSLIPSAALSFPVSFNDNFLRNLLFSKSSNTVVAKKQPSPVSSSKSPNPSIAYINLSPSSPSNTTINLGSSPQLGPSEASYYFALNPQSLGGANNFGNPDFGFYNLVKVEKQYRAPRYPIVLCHGLFGFAQLGPSNIPQLQIRYWRGVTEELERLGCEVFVPSVPPCASIEERAQSLHRQILERFGNGDSVCRINLLAHSMGGLDCRHLISRLPFPSDSRIQIKSLTTICTPHRGSPFLDWCDESAIKISRLEGTLRKGLSLPAGAFENLTTRYCQEVFNPRTPNHPDVLYYSFGASPRFIPYTSVLKVSHQIVFAREGPNDGIVSVNSAKWGTYLGTLPAAHFDFRKFNTSYFNAADFYNQVADYLHEQGL